MSNPGVQQKLAVLIDADNTSPGIIVGVLSEVAKYGVPTVRRIYGDWTTPNLGGWKATLLDHSIAPIQQFRYTSGKNATDSAMIIDAMDLLHQGALDGFCLVSSDSDFTRLAMRVRESGLMVYGFGERKTPTAFVSACHKFTFVDILVEPRPGSESPPARSTNGLSVDTEVIRILSNCVEASANEDGWANLARIGAQLSVQKADFDARHYGFAKLSALVEATMIFETKRVATSDDGHEAILVRKTPVEA